MSQHPTSTPHGPTDERLKMAIDIWKHTVSVQMHFNEMEMKTRNLYFTFLAAAVGLIGVVEGKRIVFPLWNLSFSVCFVVVAAVIPISMLFYFMDRHWYHRLLVGSVNQCMAIERMYEKELPEIQLGSKISAASPAECVSKKWKWAFFFVTEKRFRQHSRLHSDGKIEVLYKSVANDCLDYLYSLWGL